MLRHPEAYGDIYQENLQSFFILYCLQGVPYSFQTRYLPLLFKDNGMSLSYIGFYKLALIPWCIKAVWMPSMVTNGSAKREWMNLSLFLLTCIGMTVSRFPPSFSAHFTSLIIVYNAVASLFDLSLDSVVEEIRETRSIFIFDRFRRAGNHVGAILACSLVWAPVVLPWQEVFSGLAAAYFSGLMISTNILPQWSISQMRARNERGRTRRTTSSHQAIGPRQAHSHISLRRPSEDIEPYNALYVSKLLSIDGSLWMFVLLSVYKMGEQGVMNVFPLYLLDNGHSLSDVGLWTGFVAQAVMAAGSFLGVKATSRSLITKLQVHVLIRAVFVTAVWVALVLWKDFPDESYVCGIAAFLAIFFISASMTSSTLKMAFLVSLRAPPQSRKDLFDILVTADLLGKILFSSVLGGLTQLVGYEFVFGIFVAMSVAVIPLLYMVPEGMTDM